MQLFWHGLSCVRIEAEHGDQKATLITDPYDSETGLRFPRTLEPDVIVLSHQNKKQFNLEPFEKKPFVIADPGEYEVNGLFVFGEAIKGEKGADPHVVAYRFQMEGMSIAFLGGLDRMLTEEEAGKLENIDILLLPVGGGDRIKPKQAVEIMNMIEPRIVVPLYHHIDGLKHELGTADAFCKELGVCQRQDGNKLKILKKDLPAEDVVIHVLERA